MYRAHYLHCILAIYSCLWMAGKCVWTFSNNNQVHHENRPFAANDHVVQKSAMLEGKLIIIPALGRQNKGKSSFIGSGLFVRE